ncbi:type II toxin-antitoxin system Phd/YefM family antitoxin [Desulfonema magnum]|uniref:Antitoxin n=1 Tax=Desulfonema magnum TaxID=45655 RepID=A0A975BNR1_9BACT|nr:type II toxin-antitoxin system Phd/YefM family antitoxin [Desulfonema magnum]QTA88285.1 Toxin-antitoxin system, antitoxin component [Desulfonema magnum]
MQTISVPEACERLSERCESVAGDYEQIILTRENGNVVLISMDEWETYRETMLLLTDKAALKALLRSFEDHDAGKIRGKSPERHRQTGKTEAF